MKSFAEFLIKVVINLAGFVILGKGGKMKI